MLLWPFNKYPGTDYETFNWDWLIRQWEKLEDNLKIITDYRNDAVESARDAHTSALSAEAAAAIATGAVPFVTPEMFGAKGDGVTDDTDAWIEALASGKDVYGANTYVVGTGHTGSGNILTVSNPCHIIGEFIDNRIYSGDNLNQRWYGVLGIESDGVIIDAKMSNDNNLPIDDADPNNLSDAAGYGIVFSSNTNISNCTINLEVENMNGVGWGKIVKSSDIHIIANNSAYPYALNCAIGCSIEIHCADVHRALWGAVEASEAIIYCKNFTSTGNSGHVLLTNYKDDINVNHLGENSKIYIYDTGSTKFNTGAPYFNVDVDPADSAKINTEVWISGNIAANDDQQSAFFITGNGTIEGDLIIHNNLITSFSSPSRMYNDLDSIKIFTNTNEFVYIQPKTANTKVFVQGIGNGKVFLQNYAGTAYINDVDEITSGSGASVTGTIYVYSCNTISPSLTNATIYETPVPDKTITQFPGDSITVGGSSIGVGNTSSVVRITIPLAFIPKNNNYNINVNSLGITGVIGAASGAQYITNTYKYEDSIMLEYDNANTPITAGRAYQCNHSITITFT